MGAPGVRGGVDPGGPVVGFVAPGGGKIVFVISTNVEE